MKHQCTLLVVFILVTLFLVAGCAKQSADRGENAGTTTTTQDEYTDIYNPTYPEDTATTTQSTGGATKTTQPSKGGTTTTQPGGFIDWDEGDQGAADIF